MAWCHQAPSHYLNQYWPSSMRPYGVTSTHWGRMKHIGISKISHHWFREWLAACLAPSHYLNQCWGVLNLTLNIHRNSYIFIQENAYENVVYDMLAILSRPQCVKNVGMPLSWVHMTFEYWLPIDQPWSHPPYFRASLQNGCSRNGHSFTWLCEKDCSNSNALAMECCSKTSIWSRGYLARHYLRKHISMAQCKTAVSPVH